MALRALLGAHRGRGGDNWAAVLLVKTNVDSGGWAARSLSMMHGENKRGCFIYVAYVAMITHGSVGLSTDSLQEPMVLCMPLTDGA